MSTNLMEASRQWATRPDDERFWTLADMRAALALRHSQAREAVVPFGALTVRPTEGDDLVLVGPAGLPADFTHYSFGQLCGRVGAPAEFLGQLPATQAAKDLNHMMARAEDRGKDAYILGQQNGATIVRAITSDIYSRAWDDNLIAALEDLQGDGWRVPPARPARAGQAGTRPATAEDLLSDEHGLSVNLGDPIAPAGLYAGDRDMFIFMVNEGQALVDGQGHELSRGFFLENSEVGCRSFGVTAFHYDHVCGNHIVWGAKDVVQVRMRHVGDGMERKAIAELRTQLGIYARISDQQEKDQLAAAQRFRLGDDKDAVVDAVAPKVALSKKRVADAYDDGEEQGYDPRTAWGLAQGVTRLSQRYGTADKRSDMDRAAGRILRMAF